MRYFVVLLTMTAGCMSMASSPAVQVQGPSAADQERALELVWEGVYGMTRDTRPAITWWAACPGGHENEGCYDEYSTPGNVNLIWIGTNPTTGAVLGGRTISSTMFSEQLEGEREWIVYPPGQLATIAEAARLTKQAQDSLSRVGL